MIQTRPLARSLVLLCAGTLMAACGGDNTPTPQPDPPYEQLFNTYLPLAVGASLSYQDSNVGSIESMHILDSALSQNAGADVYEVTFDSASNTFSFFMASDANRIRVFGIDGPIAVESGGVQYSLDNLRFASPLIMQSNSSNQNSGNTTATAVIRSGSLSANLNNIAISYQTTNLDTTYYGSYGTLPVRAALFRASVNASINVFGQNVAIDETLTNTLLFAKGIGIVRHAGTYVSVDDQYNSELTSLNNLPRTIWYNYNNGNPRLASGSSNVFQINGQGTISSNDYRLANMDQINALRWITVQEGSGRYTVSLNSNSSLPTTNSSVEVVFEHKVTERRLSANVTLLAP